MPTLSLPSGLCPLPWMAHRALEPTTMPARRPTSPPPRAAHEPMSRLPPSLFCPPSRALFRFYRTTARVANNLMACDFIRPVLLSSDPCRSGFWGRRLMKW